jgi:tetratricopeptide (TPR) repeat protein
MSKAIAQMRKNLRVQIKRAREMYAEGEKYLEEGSVMRAASAFTMATSFDPRNVEYREAAKNAQRAARKIQAKNFVQLAESAESFANLREALVNYQKAVDYGVEEARPYYRLGVLIRRIEEDHRAALDHFRAAVKKEPRNLEFRQALGELYADLGLKVNAQGQFKRILSLDKGNSKAKAALKSL